MTTRAGDRTALRSVAGLRVGDEIMTQLADGKLWSRLERTTTDDAHL
ncbi:MAG: hypothetical protein LW698_03130 [Planctomycetaceae bacterium]|nr:hypothetical protein [Planctomycetaceae bacterium]